MQWRRASPLLQTLEQVRAGSFGRSLHFAGVLDELGDGEPFTLFAPLDELPSELLDDPEGLERVIGFHIIRGAALRTHELGPAVSSSIGQRLEVRRSSRGAMSVDGAALVGPDLAVGAGVVHIIDRLLFPAQLDLLELLHISDNFHRLVTVCELLGLEDELRGAEPYTLLAPRGLTLLETWRWHAWLQPRGRPYLRQLLERHIVPGRCYLDDHEELTNLAGQALTVRRSVEGCDIDGQQVLIPDIDARNGLIHVIEGFAGS